MILRAYYFAAFAGLGVLMPFLPPWLEARGVVGIGMGAIAATSPAMGLLGPPLFGLVADAFGKRAGLLRVAAAGAFASMATLALFAVLGKGLSFPLLFVLLLAFAACRSPMNTLADLVAIDVAATGESTYGRIRLWGSLGFVAGAVFGGRAVDARALAPMPVVVGAAFLGAAIAAFALPRERATAKARATGTLRAMLRDAPFRAFLLTTALSQLAHSAYDVAFSLHLRDRGFTSDRVGLAWGLGVLAEVLLMAAPPWLVSRARPERLLGVALAGASVRWALIAVVRDPLVLFALQPLHALSFALVWLASLRFVRERTSREIHGSAQGIFVASHALGSIAGMIAWAPLYGAFGGSAIFAAASGIALVACLSSLRLSAATRAEVAAAI